MVVVVGVDTIQDTDTTHTLLKDDTIFSNLQGNTFTAT